MYKRQSRPFAQAVPQTRLIVLPELGHMVQNAVPDLVISEVDRMVAALGAGDATSMREYKSPERSSGL